jgi:hypothetical protein
MRLQLSPTHQKKLRRRLRRVAVVFPLLLLVGGLDAMSAEAPAGAAGTARLHQGAATSHFARGAVLPRASVPYGAGKAFCNPWGGLSIDGKNVANVYPCSNPNTADRWNTYQCADYTNRYEWATFGLTAPVNGGEIVRYLHNHSKVPIQATGKGNLPKPGDALSMWGNASTDPPGHTGVVYSVSVNAAGNGTIVYLDQNGSLSGGRNIGEDTVYVKNWVFSTHWSAYYAYSNFDWTLQANAYPSGAFIDYGGNVYRMVGGAPLYVSAWAAVGGGKPYTTVTTAQFDSLSQYPANGSAVYEASGPLKGTGYVFVGGAPLVVTNWANVGKPQITGVDPAALNTFAASGPYSHVRQYPLNGTAIYEESGPSKGTGFVFAGGAPLVVTNWKNVGSPPVTGVDPAALASYASSGPFSHVRQYPLNGTAVYEASGTLKGSGFVFAGGAPLAVANWMNINSPKITGVDPAALDTYATSGAFSHVAAVPANGTFLSTKSGGTYRAAGGYAFAIASCSDIGGCTSPTLVDAWAIAHAGSASAHLAATPVNGTEVLAEPSGGYWTFESGDKSPGTASTAAVKVDDTSVSSFPTN